MRKEVKCFHCKEIGNKTEMVKDTNYSTVRYIHKECHSEYMKKMMVKCKYCDEKSVYKFDPDAKKEEGNFHADCYKKFLEEKAFKEKEMKELSELIEYLLKLFRVKFFNNGVYTILASVRNGDNGILGARAVRNREGYDYALILEGFKYCHDDIEYAFRTKDFNGLNNALKYVMYIVTDKLPKLEEARNRRKQQQLEQEAKFKSISDGDIEDIIMDDDEEARLLEEKRKKNKQKKKKYGLLD